MRKLSGWLNRSYKPSSIAGVISQPVDLDLISARVGGYLEGNGATCVHTLRGCKALNARITDAGDIPLALGRAREAVLGLDAVSRRTASCPSGSRNNRERESRQKDAIEYGRS